MIHELYIFGVHLRKAYSIGLPNMSRFHKFGYILTMYWNLCLMSSLRPARGLPSSPFDSKGVSRS